MMFFVVSSFGYENDPRFYGWVWRFYGSEQARIGELAAAYLGLGAKL